MIPISILLDKTVIKATMEQRLTFITLGVNDLDQMKAWYRDIFGWTLLKDEDGICFIKLNGIILGLFPAAELAEDIGITEDGIGFKRFSLAINLKSQAEVDICVEDLRTKGVRIVRDPEPVFWGGYRGYISDPEANYWELAYNPYLPLDSSGNVL
jgi:catechol 2,3-dioxygenase-like lactoylglutathione lyase family enzyme